MKDLHFIKKHEECSCERQYFCCLLALPTTPRMMMCNAPIHLVSLLYLFVCISIMFTASHSFSANVVRRIGPTSTVRARARRPSTGWPEGHLSWSSWSACGCADQTIITNPNISFPKRSRTSSLRLFSVSVDVSRDHSSEEVPDATATSGTTTTATTNLQEKDLSPSLSTTTTSKNASSSRNSTSKTPKTTRINANTGGLRRLPSVRNAQEMVNRARRVAHLVKPDKTQLNGKLRAHKHGAMRLHCLTNELCGPLRDTFQGYHRELRRLHPFEKVVADLTTRSRQAKDGVTLQDVLDDMDEARKMMRQAGKEWIAKVKMTANAREAGTALDEAVEALAVLFEELAAPHVTLLVDLQKGLRHAPVIQLDTPAVVLVGAPNVGKSSIVRAISSASPEVNNYPFTTRGMTLGHVEVFWSASKGEDGDNEFDTHVAKAVVPDPRRRPGVQSKQNVTEDNDDDHTRPEAAQQYAFSQLCQIMDSPGLLVRDDESKRNEMEQLTVAAMQHLPTAVCYVMDFSGMAGDKCSSVADQLTLRRQIRARFPRRPWIDVVSKVDLGFQDDGSALRELQEIIDQEEHTSPYIELSIHEGTGVSQLRSEILRMLGEVRVVLDAMTAVQVERKLQQQEQEQQQRQVQQQEQQQQQQQEEGEVITV